MHLCNETKFWASCTWKSTSEDPFTSCLSKTCFMLLEKVVYHLWLSGLHSFKDSSVVPPCPLYSCWQCQETTLQKSACPNAHFGLFLHSFSVVADTMLKPKKYPNQDERIYSGEKLRTSVWEYFPWHHVLFLSSLVIGFLVSFTVSEWRMKSFQLWFTFCGREVETNICVARNSFWEL